MNNRKRKEGFLTTRTGTVLRIHFSWARSLQQLRRRSGDRLAAELRSAVRASFYFPPAPRAKRPGSASARVPCARRSPCGSAPRQQTGWSGARLRGGAMRDDQWAGGRGHASLCAPEGSHGRVQPRWEGCGHPPKRPPNEKKNEDGRNSFTETTGSRLPYAVRPPDAWLSLWGANWDFMTARF
uniref:uncharacterized protein LOC114601894 isoform X2 n=1 Tax=Podarcis muralis TaxID=64176 RepID=UPI0010A04EB0|nr:uncharacterized protein LOC114601894 isoform X2 [Podarcis muralis]